MNTAHRKFNKRILFKDSSGRPLANAGIKVEQTGHKFLFGCGAFDFIPYVMKGEENFRQITESWQEIFNYGTLPFYWGRYEPVEGQPNKEALLKTARYMKERGIKVKGHPLVEAITTWDYKDGAWLKAPSGFIRLDNSKKPSFEMLKKLVKEEWWTKTTVKTDEDGWADVEGFKGDYRISVDDRKAEASFTDNNEECVVIV